MGRADLRLHVGTHYCFLNFACGAKRQKYLAHKLFRNCPFTFCSLDLQTQGSFLPQHSTFAKKKAQCSINYARRDTRPHSPVAQSHERKEHENGPNAGDQNDHHDDGVAVALFHWWLVTYKNTHHHAEEEVSPAAGTGWVFLGRFRGEAAMRLRRRRRGGWRRVVTDHHSVNGESGGGWNSSGGGSFTHDGEGGS